MKKKVLIFLFDGFADWEIAYLTPEINKNKEFELIYFSKDGQPVSSMGGLTILPNTSLKEVDTKEVDMLILPGGDAWEKDTNTEIEPIVKALFSSRKGIAAICAATTYLGKLGILNHLKHTSNDLNYLQGIAPQYTGAENYINSLAVSDKHIITASGLGAIEFTKEIFEKLELFGSTTIEKWFQVFKNGIFTA